MTDKYINKKWVDTKMKYDPLYLFENKRSKFDRWLKKRRARAGVEEESEEEEVVQKKPTKPSKPVK